MNDAPRDHSIYLMATHDPMAAPNVPGVRSLWMSAHPKNSVTHAHFVTVLRASVTLSLTAL
jgi:hypothetical protein